MTRLLLILLFASPVLADFDANKLADAIYKAENSKTHPYGILATYKHTSPRQACINTINHQLKNWNSAGSKGDFIEFLGRTYCPPAAHSLNKNWVKNVRYFLKVERTK